jgi:acetamidase/formamidase
MLDIREATRDAVRHMITFLGAEHGLNRVEAYMLCSVAGDLRLCEVVRVLPLDSIVESC